MGAKNDGQQSICENLSHISSHCKEVTNNRVIVKSEGNAQVRIKNDNEEKAVIIHIDGCVITGSDRQRCDYLILRCEQNKAYLVEFKGSNLEHAYSQIDSTLTIIDDLGFSGYPVDAIIVLTRTPIVNYRSSSRIALQRKLARKGGQIISQNRTVKVDWA